MKRILITGAGSYIGTSFEAWLKKPEYAGMYQVDTIDMRGDGWKQKDFSGYDTVFHVAGIAHADIGKVTEEQKKLYYAVNCDMAAETARKAKKEGVKQFIYMSSIIVYGEGSSVRKKRVITRETKPSPSNFYGDSKWKAEKKLRPLSDETFHVAILRPPMIYGEGCKGNYQTLRKIALHCPVFPNFPNERSMLYIANLTEFLRQIIEDGRGGMFFPQNTEYVRTSHVVKKIAYLHHRNIWISRIWNPIVWFLSRIPGKVGNLCNKAFGSLVYEKNMSTYEGIDYQKEDFDSSVRKTEMEEERNTGKKTIWIIDHYSSEPKYGGISRQYDFAKELGKHNYNVVVIASGFSHFHHDYISEKNIFVNEIDKNVHYVYLRTSAYESNGGLGRARNMFDFMRKVWKYEKSIAKKYGIPDVITGCSVHPLAWVAAYRIAQKYKIRFCAEVRDFWPRIWVVSGEKKPYDPMVLFFGMIQKWTYKKADRIIYSMYHGDKYICGELGFDKKKTYLIGQPMDCQRFDENRERMDLLPEQVRNFIKDGFICSFAGYYMTYEGVYVMLEALKILQERNISDIKMVFVGSGQEKEGMQTYIKQNDLKNVRVFDRIPKESVPALISHSDICMAHLEVQGHKEVYKYGVSKNKVNEYLYSGACTLYGFLYKDDEVAASGAGMVFEPYNPGDLADKIESVYHMAKEERQKFGERGRKYIRETRSVEVLTDKMLEVLFGTK